MGRQSFTKSSQKPSQKLSVMVKRGEKRLRERDSEGARRKKFTRSLLGV